MPAIPLTWSTPTRWSIADGSLWAFDSGENVARINPVTGRIIRIYSAARYDPQDNLSLNFFAVDRNSIWFLRAADIETTAVLRVSLATGRPHRAGLRCRLVR